MVMRNAYHALIIQVTDSLISPLLFDFCTALQAYEIHGILVSAFPEKKSESQKKNQHMKKTKKQKKPTFFFFFFFLLNYKFKK